MSLIDQPQDEADLLIQNVGFVCQIGAPLCPESSGYGKLTGFASPCKIVCVQMKFEAGAAHGPDLENRVGEA